MDQHDDLMAAALDAVAAVEAHSTDGKTSVHQSVPSDGGIMPSNRKNSADSSCNDFLTNIAGSLDLIDPDSDADLPEIEFSLSGFGALEESSASKHDDEAHADVDAASNSPGSAKLDELAAQNAELNAALEAANLKNQDLQTENDQLRAIQKQLNERVVRVTADFENYRKRVVRDQEHMKNQAEERIVSAFLPVMDNLERALGHAKQSDDYQRLLQGVEMIGRLYRDALIKLGCMPFESMGAEFDPVYHDVLQRVVDPDKPHNSVVQVHLRGYKMHDHVLRPALVVVAQHEDAASEGEN